MYSDLKRQHRYAIWRGVQNSISTTKLINNCPNTRGFCAKCFLQRLYPNSRNNGTILLITSHILEKKEFFFTSLSFDNSLSNSCKYIRMTIFIRTSLQSCTFCRTFQLFEGWRTNFFLHKTWALYSVLQ